MRIFIQYLLPSLHPEVLETHFIFLPGLVASPEVGMLPGEPAKPVRISAKPVRLSAQFRCHARGPSATQKSRDSRPVRHGRGHLQHFMLTGWALPGLVRNG
jgi:hypothetical protein